MVILLPYFLINFLDNQQLPENINVIKNRIRN